MKAAITPENKERFCALYWGQKIMFSKYERHRKLVPVMGGCRHEEWCIQLKPLSSISDEDAIEVAKMFGWQLDSGGLSSGRMHGLRQILCGDSPFGNSGRPFIEGQWNVVDFLRFRGYALPFMGLSVEEMVDAGWIRLTP